MRFRRSSLPRCAGDWCALLFLLSSVAVTFVCELAIVLPALSSGAAFWLQAVLAVFVLYNVLGNMLACMLVDTSTHGLLMPATCRPGWHFCAACEATAPPRSWHCTTCGSCVLRRDHHCIFTGACVGHFNARYFFVFLAFTAAGALYSSVLNTLFVCRVLGGFRSISWLQFIMPTAMLLLGGANVSMHQVYALLFTLDWVGFLFVTSLLVYHLLNAVRGMTVHERAHGPVCYDLGWRENLRQMFGSRWYWTWLSPAIHSPLPGDGLSFITADQWKQDARKHR